VSDADRLRNKYTHTIENDGEWKARLEIGNQTFDICDWQETKEEAVWYCDMMGKALVKLLAAQSTDLSNMNVLNADQAGEIERLNVKVFRTDHLAATAIGEKDTEIAKLRGALENSLDAMEWAFTDTFFAAQKEGDEQDGSITAHEKIDKAIHQAKQALSGKEVDGE